MIEAVSVLIALVLLGALVVLIDIAASLRAVRRRAERQGPSFDFPFPFPPVSPRHFLPFSGLIQLPNFAIWVFENGVWKLMRPCGQPNCECQGPQEQGEYEGQVVRKECPSRG